MPSRPEITIIVNIWKNDCRTWFSPILLNTFLSASSLRQTWHIASASTHWHFAFGLCCHSNETRAPIANPPNSAQLGDTRYHSHKLNPGPCSSVGMPQGQTDRQTHTQTQTHTHTHTHAHTDASNQYTFCVVYTHTKCNKKLIRRWDSERELFYNGHRTCRG